MVLSHPEEIKQAVMGLQPNDTFAVRTEPSYGTSWDYCIVKRHKNPDIGNGFVQIERYKRPWSDHAEEWSLKHGVESLDTYAGRDADPKPTDDGIWLMKLGRSPTEVTAVSVDTFATEVEYEPNVTLGIKCKECGQTATKQKVVSGPNNRSDDSIRTPCCNSDDWETVLVDE